MKTKFALLAAWLTAVAGLSAAPVAATTAVHARPQAGAPIISYLKAGTAPVFVEGAPAPAGWAAVELTGPFEVYVQRKDLTKNLEPRPGSEVHLQPKPESPVLTIAEKGDKAEITGQFQGKWTQITLEKRLVGYIQVSSAAPALAPAPAPAAPKSRPEPAPAAPVASFAGAGQPAPMVNSGDGGSTALPRAIQGTFVSSKRPFMPRRPYDYQINDDAGVRYAYLDLSKLLLTDVMEKYLDRVVIVYGTAKALPNSKDIVIEVETLQLR